MHLIPSESDAKVGLFPDRRLLLTVIRAQKSPPTFTGGWANKMEKTFVILSERIKLMQLCVVRYYDVSVFILSYLNCRVRVVEVPKRSRQVVVVLELRGF